MQENKEFFFWLGDEAQMKFDFRNKDDSIPPQEWTKDGEPGAENPDEFYKRQLGEILKSWGFKEVDDVE